MRTAHSSPWLREISFFLLFFFLFPFFLQAQSGPGRNFSSEIQNIERRLAFPGVPPGERHDTLVYLARLRRLSGNIEAAARAWTEAASAEPGKRDDGALLSAAECLIALGEFDQAEAYTRTVVSGSRDSRIIARARYLYAQTAAFRSGNIQGLLTLLNDSASADMKPALYYTLWKISGSEMYRSRLLAEYLRSPEAMILAGEAAPSPTGEVPVSLEGGALWFFFPGREGISRGPAVPQAPAPVPAAENAAPLALQTGLYSREANAQTMADRLRRLGFQPEISRRTINGAAYWRVTVSPGSDSTRTMLALKEAGIESFPVF